MVIHVLLRLLLPLYHTGRPLTIPDFHIWTEQGRVEDILNDNMPLIIQQILSPGCRHLIPFSHTSRNDAGWYGLAHSWCCTSSQRCWTEWRSGFCVGHSSSSTPITEIYFFTELRLWHQLTDGHNIKYTQKASFMSKSTWMFAHNLLNYGYITLCSKIKYWVWQQYINVSCLLGY